MRNEELNPEQLQAVTHKTGPLLVLAGAGSGKTKVLVHRVIKLIEEDGVPARSIVLLTFTNKAAEEMKQRIKNILGEGVSLGFVGTFHTFCVKLLREFGEYIGVNKKFVIFDSEDSEALIKTVLKELNIDPKESKPGMFSAVISKMKNDFKSIGDLEKTSENYFYKQVLKVWKLYQSKLTKNAAMDFDDLLVKAVELLQNPQIKEKINTRLKWILVDEYQDTNKVQFELTRQLAGEERNLTVVGDASQAIYSFRGADFRNLLLLKQEFADIKMVELPKNYRSTQNILDSAYSVVKNNNGHPVIKLESTQEEGDKIELIENADEADEARMIVKEAEKYADKNEEVAVLYRTNAQSRAIEEELIRRRVPYKLVGGVRFYGRAEIKDLIAFLRLINNKDEEVSVGRIEKIGKRKARVFFDWLGTKNETLVDENPATVLNEVINNVGYLDKFDERDEADVARIENINELLAVASLYKTIPEFLESAALAEAETKKTSSNAKIILMTVHSAKGLEFVNVIVAGLEEGMFPHSRSITLGSKDELEEERRLMYVAMTRAKKVLILSYARSRLVFGGRHTCIPSRFLSEIDGKLVERKYASRLEQRYGEDTFEELKESRTRELKKETRERRIVQDWEIEKETKQDFNDVDNW